MEEKLRKGLESLGKKLTESRSKSIKVTVSLYITTSWVVVDVFDRWVLTIKQLPPAEGQDENYINKTSDTLRSRIIAIAEEVQVEGIMRVESEVRLLEDP